MAVRRNPNIAAPVGVAPQVIPAAGGSWHIYPNGRKVFVKAGGATAVTQVPGTAGQPAASGPAQFGPDSQYFQWDAAALAKKQADLAENERQGTVNRTTYETALRKLKEQQPVDESNQTSASNRQGLFYSTNLGNKLGDIAKSYVERRTQTQTSYDQSERARQAARAAIEAGYGVDQAAQYAASLDRQIGRDTSAADAGALVPETTAGSAASQQSSLAPPPPLGYKTVRQNHQIIHLWKNGRRVVVGRY